MLLDRYAVSYLYCWTGMQWNVWTRSGSSWKAEKLWRWMRELCCLLSAQRWIVCRFSVCRLWPRCSNVVVNGLTCLIMQLTKDLLPNNNNNNNIYAGSCWQQPQQWYFDRVVFVCQKMAVLSLFGALTRLVADIQPVKCLTHLSWEEVNCGDYN